MTWRLCARPPARPCSRCSGCMFRSPWPSAWCAARIGCCPSLLMVAMALAATLSWRAAGNGLSTRLICCGRPDGRRIGVCLSSSPGIAWQIDMHMYFFAGAGLSGRLLRLSADPCRHGRGRAASSGAELHAAGGGLSRRRRLWPRRAACRDPADRGRRLDLACADALAPVRDRRAEDGGSRSANAAEARANAERTEAEQRCQAGTRRGEARTRRRLRAQDRPYRRGGRGGRQRNAGHVLVDERQQRAKPRARRRPPPPLDPGLGQCRDGRLRNRRTDGLDQQHRAAGDALRRDRRQGRRGGAPHQHRGRGTCQPAPRRSAKW